MTKKKPKKKKGTKECPICSKLRPLTKHLYELSEYCIYLGNTAEYKKDDNTRIVHTKTIGDWLLLASQLEKVEINFWKYAAGDAYYCGSAADYYDRTSNHFTAFSTDLTRFIFICNALEETYRFVAYHYDSLPEIKQLSQKKRLKEPSMKACFLLDQCTELEIPKNLRHIVSSFDKAYEFYKKGVSPQMSGMEKVKMTDLSYGLHLVRNLRNHIVHGVFPLLDNPEDVGDNSGRHHLLVYMLRQGARVSALYIQMLVVRYGIDFLSWEYDQVKGARGAVFKRFLRNCTPEYAKSLHFQGRFEFENWIGN
jgi:hypothetical protein